MGISRWSHLPNKSSAFLTRTILGRSARIAFGIAGVTAIAVALARTLNAPIFTVIPSPRVAALAGIFMVASLWLSGRSWAVLFEASSTYPLVRGYVLAQLGKYIPGSVWGAVGQVSAATRQGVTGASASVGLIVQAIAQVAGAGTLAAIFAATALRTPLQVRVASAMGVGLVAFLHRSWMIWTLRQFSRLLRTNIPTEIVPAQRRILSAYLWSVCAIGSTSIAFWLLLAGIAETPGLVTTGTAFSAAWGAGFLVVMFPSGLGVREGVLVLTLGAEVGAGRLLAASAGHRLVTIVAEILLIGLMLLFSRLLPGRVSSPASPARK